MNVLVTGATGFIGSSFIRKAIAGGHKVAGLVIPSETAPADLAKRPEISWVKGSLEEAPWSEIRDFRPDVCLHTAWITTPGVYLESEENYRFMQSSLAFMLKAREEGAKHLVGLGTCVEYAVSSGPLAENSPVAPATTYARCKNELRLALEDDARINGGTVCWARVFYPYGPGEHPSRLCSSIITRLARDERVFLKTPDSTKDYIFIEDLAEAILVLVEKAVEGPINLGTGTGISVREIEHFIAEKLGKPGLIEEANPPETDPLGNVVADSSRLRSLGWAPAHTFEAGLDKLLCVWRARLDARRTVT